MDKKLEFNTEDNNLRFIIESAFAKQEKANARLWVICIILIVALIASNAGWIYWESQWQYVQTETTVEASQEGDNNFLSGGDLYYGAESEDN